MKDLTPYPNLKMYAGTIYHTELIYPVLGVNYLTNSILSYVNGEDEAMGLVWMEMGKYNLSPLLRPLSDLTKEIIHNGETFVPLNEIKTLSVNIEYYENHIKPYLSPLTEFLITTKNHLPSWVTEKLCEWHFDVFGLIGRGLALPMEE